MDKYLIKKLRTQDSSTWWWLWLLDFSTKKKKFRNILEKIHGVATAKYIYVLFELEQNNLCYLSRTISLSEETYWQWKTNNETKLATLDCGRIVTLPIFFFFFWGESHITNLYQIKIIKDRSFASTYGSVLLALSLFLYIYIYI